MKIMTFNIQHAMDHRYYLENRAEKIDFDLIADVIVRLNAEIIGLNEVRGESAHPDFCDQVGEIASRVGFPYCYFAKAILFRGSDPYGNALISKYPILSAQTIPIPDPEVKDEGTYYETRCVLKAEIDVGGKVLTVFSTHFGLARAEAKNAVAVVLSELQTVKTPCVLMGDFNLTPDDQILAPLFAVLSDSASLLCRRDLPSFPSECPRIKIDYLLTTKDVCVKSAAIPPIVASDHLPYIADIEW